MVHTKSIEQINLEDYGKSWNFKSLKSMYQGVSVLSQEIYALRKMENHRLQNVYTAFTHVDAASMFSA